MTLVENAVQAETSYGYWIDEKGALIPVHYDGDHYRVVRDKWDDVSPNEYETAMSEGWVRVVSYREGHYVEFSADTYGKHTSEAALKSLFKLALDFADAECFFYTDELLGVQKKYDSVRDFINGVRRLVRTP